MGFCDPANIHIYISICFQPLALVRRPFASVRNENKINILSIMRSRMCSFNAIYRIGNEEIAVVVVDDLSIHNMFGDMLARKSGDSS